MVTRRQHRIARVIRESVSKTILTGLNDPRINGLVSVTEVDVSPDMKNATVYLSIMTPENHGQQKVFEAICHASRHIQHQLGNEMTGKFCPQLEFKQDQKVKKTLQTLQLIEEAQNEYEEHSLLESQEENIEKQEQGEIHEE